MEIFFLLLYITIPILALYFIIRLAVSHAIKDNLENIESVMKRAIKTSINEKEWRENN
ncbi:hypothetical protein ACH36K_14045 [Clostridium sp. MB05]|jgi:hypothetical protein|uniref:hypothetical protein n=1 Tax=Clostridium sp. MB05 TaxID=3376682 RepID=UPI003981FE17